MAGLVVLSAGGALGEATFTSVVGKGPYDAAIGLLRSSAQP